MYDPKNIFAQILDKTIPCQKIFENETVLAFHDITPQAPVHALIVPKSAHVSFDDFIENAQPEEITAFFKSVHKVAEMLNIREQGYRMIANHGHHGSQEVPHFHVHLLSGEPLGPLVTKKQ